MCVCGVHMYMCILCMQRTYVCIFYLAYAGVAFSGLYVCSEMIRVYFVQYKSPCACVCFGCFMFFKLSFPTFYKAGLVGE